MLTETPWAFAATPVDDRALDPAQVPELLSREHNAVFAVEAPSPDDSRSSSGAARELVAAAGVFRDSAPKFAHRARIWGVFVDAAYRGNGFGRAVVTVAIDLARTWNGVEFVGLGVSERSVEARRLYDRLGFEAWGREPEVTLWEGRRYDEIHLTLRLR
jgi:ribosomal protein S18 acetylase RimI-like enzyme